ncbi:MAG: hypothetical protein ACK559_20650, partial [bacterium]
MPHVRQHPAHLVAEVHVAAQLRVVLRVRPRAAQEVPDLPHAVALQPVEAVDLRDVDEARGVVEGGQGLLE